MNRLLLLTLILSSCGAKEEIETFEYDLLDSTFVTKSYKESTSATQWYGVTGSQTYLFSTNLDLTITFDGYKENSSKECSGTVNYTYEIKTKTEFESALSDASTDADQFDDDIFSIFTPHEVIEEIEDVTSDEDDEVKVIDYYIIGKLITNNVNITCQINQPDSLFLFVKLFKEGDLTIYNFNRQIYQLTTGIN